MKNTMKIMNPVRYSPVTAEEAVSVVKSGDKIFVHTAAAAPKTLVQALAARGHELKEVEIYQMHTEGEASYAARNSRITFWLKACLRALMCGGQCRKGAPILCRFFSAIFRSCFAEALCNWTLL